MTRSEKPADVRTILCQAVADLAQLTLWLPGRYAWDKDRAIAALTGLTGDVARAGMAVRRFPGYPPDWPGYSHAAAIALAEASRREADLTSWLADMLATIPGEHGTPLAAALSTSAKSESDA